MGRSVGPPWGKKGGSDRGVRGVGCMRAVCGAEGGGAHRSDADGFVSARKSLRVDGIGIDPVVRRAGVRETRGRRGASRAVTSRTPEMQQS